MRAAALTGLLLLTGALALASALAVTDAGVAFSETGSEVVYSHKHWEVEIVALDDGSFACLAEGDATTESFSIWTYQDQTARLQVSSTAWECGDPGYTADLNVQIDRRAP